MTDHAPLTGQPAPAIATAARKHDATARQATAGRATSAPSALLQLQAALDQRPAIILQRQLRTALSHPSAPPGRDRAAGTVVQRMYNGEDDPVAGQAVGGQGAQPGMQGGQANAAGQDNWADFDAAFGNQAPQPGGADDWAFGAFQGAGNAANGGGNFDFDAAVDNLHGDHAPPPAPVEADLGAEVGIGEHVTLAGPMYTNNLYNCIALVGHNPETGTACLYHWNTAANAFENNDAYFMEDDDQHDRGQASDGDAGGERVYPYQPSAAGIAATKAIVDSAAPGASVYHLVFGRSWGDGQMDHYRPAFEAVLRAVFPNITIADEAHGSAQWANAALTGFG